MRHAPMALTTIACVYCACAIAQDSQPVFSKTSGDAELGRFEVDNAPGTVSAMGYLGIAADQSTVVQNPRDLTVAAKAFDGKNAFGIAITPARTALAPMNVSTYAGNSLARLWGSTTFSYAQARAEVSGLNFERRAFAVETSYFFRPAVDDPLIMYWNALTAAAERRPVDESDPCVLIPPQKPEQGEGDGFRDVPKPLKADLDKRAQECRSKVEKLARWNVSRAWASYGRGTYKPVDGSGSHSLGRTAVLGVTYGIGEKDVRTAIALTAAVKRTWSSPTEATMGSATPDRTDSTLYMGRMAVGGEKLRAVLQASHGRSDAPTAMDRTYKRALGLDVWLGEGMWLNVRAGKQRRRDNQGDETGSSIGLSYSPKALLDF